MDGLRNIARTFRAEYRKTPNTLKVPPPPPPHLEAYTYMAPELLKV